MTGPVPRTLTGALRKRTNRPAAASLVGGAKSWFLGVPGRVNGRLAPISLAEIFKWSVHFDDGAFARAFVGNLRDRLDCDFHFAPQQLAQIPFELLAALPVPTGRGHDFETRPSSILLNKLIVADRIQIILADKQVLAQNGRADQFAGRCGKAFLRTALDGTEQREAPPAGAPGGTAYS